MDDGADSVWYVVGPDDAKYKVFVVHWWPGRQYKRGFCPVPQGEVDKALLYKTKYMTYACASTPDGDLEAYSKCMKLDNPSRVFGRNRALGLLRREALSVGLDLIGVPRSR